MCLEMRGGGAKENASVYMDLPRYFGSQRRVDYLGDQASGG